MICLSKSTKWELGFVDYAEKFTISRFVISMFDCTYIGECNLSFTFFFLIFVIEDYNLMLTNKELNLKSCRTCDFHTYYIGKDGIIFRVIFVKHEICTNPLIINRFIVALCCFTLLLIYLLPLFLLLKIFREKYIVYYNLTF